jgi:hypothetical protein
MAKPVLVVVDGDDTSLQKLTRELESRYGSHYEVVSSSSADVALSRLAELKAAGADGDVRHGSMKRVASAVGDGSTAIRLVHDYLALARPVREGQ